MKTSRPLTATLAIALTAAGILVSTPAAQAAGGVCTIAPYVTNHSTALGWGAAVDQQTNTVYVANPAANTVSMIDGVDGSDLRKPIPVGQNPHHLVVNQQTNTIYVANSNDGTVSVIDGATGTVTATIDLKVGPGGRVDAVAIDDTTGRVFVTNESHFNSGGGVDVFGFGIDEIDPQSNLVHFEVIDSPVHINNIAIDSARRTLDLDVQGKGVVSVYDVDSFAPVADIPVGDKLNTLAVNSATGAVYVANEGDSTVSVIDGERNRVVQTVPVAGPPRAIAISTIANAAYVVNDGDDGTAYLGGQVTVINGDTNTVDSPPMAADFGGVGAAFDNTTRRLFVTSKDVQVFSEIVGPSIVSGPMPDSSVGAKYNFTIATTGFPGASLSVTSGTFPPGLNLNNVTGLVKGSPTRPGTYRFRITASNSATATAHADYTVTVR